VIGVRTYGSVWIDEIGTGLPTGFDPVGVGLIIVIFVIVMGCLLMLARPSSSERCDTKSTTTG
jgi:hypothetical protein